MRHTELGSNRMEPANPLTGFRMGRSETPDQGGLPPRDTAMPDVVEPSPIAHEGYGVCTPISNEFPCTSVGPSGAGQYQLVRSYTTADPDRPRPARLRDTDEQKASCNFVRESLFARIRNRSRPQTEGDKRTEGIEPRSYIPGASVDGTEEGYDALGRVIKIDCRACQSWMSPS
jgi:hypothetical protein